MHVSAFMSAALTTTKKIKQSSKTGAFSHLLLPHPSEASEAKPVSMPFLGNQVMVYLQSTLLPYDSRSYGNSSLSSRQKHSGKSSP